VNATVHEASNEISAKGAEIELLASNISKLTAECRAQQVCTAVGFWVFRSVSLALTLTGCEPQATIAQLETSVADLRTSLADKQRDVEAATLALESRRETENLMKDTLKDMNEELEQRVEAVKAAEARTLLLESQLSNCTDELAAARHTMQQLEVSCFAHCRGIVCPRVSSSVLLWSGASV
jgi:outer membrane murein-binding lipoprotein Lpp